MLHNKFQGHWPFGSREEDFLRFFTDDGQQRPTYPISSPNEPSAQAS